jgi:hypothetical protein
VTLLSYWVTALCLGRHRRGDGDTEFAGIVKQASGRGTKRWLYKQLEQRVILLVK